LEAHVRVQIPAYTDHWMRGDRYGEVLRVRKSAVHDHTRGRPDLMVLREIATVLLDKSRKTTRVILDDCQEV